MTRPSAQVLIAGAGIGGLAAALALSRAGATVTILEQAPALAEVGAGLQISPNASRILARLGVLDALVPLAVQPSAIHVRAASSARTLSVMPLTDAQQRWGGPYLLLRRADLQRVLFEAATADPAITLHLDTAVAGFGTTATGVQVSARQNRISRTFDADALVGADGIRSRVRARLAGAAEDPPLETGRTAWRALVAREAVDPAFARAETSLWLGPDAHLVHYPMREQAWINVVAITREKTSGGADLWAEPGDPAQVNARFAKWHRTARDLVRAATSWTRWPLFDRAPLAAWNAGPIALLGDAAHPVLPFLAQGSAQAIEDAAVLAASFAARRTPSDAFALYSQTRQARVARVQQASRQLGRIYHLTGPMALARDATMRFSGPSRLLARYDWLYGAAT